MPMKMILWGYVSGMQLFVRAARVDEHCSCFAACSCTEVSLGLTWTGQRKIFEFFLVDVVVPLQNQRPCALLLDALLTCISFLA